MTARHENAAFGAEINQDCEAHYTETEHRVFESVCLLGLGVTKVDLSNCKLYTTPSFFTDLCFCGLVCGHLEILCGRSFCLYMHDHANVLIRSLGCITWFTILWRWCTASPKHWSCAGSSESNYWETEIRIESLCSWSIGTNKEKSKWFKHWLDLPRISNCLQSYTLPIHTDSPNRCSRIASEDCAARLQFFPSMVWPDWQSNFTRSSYIISAVLSLFSSIKPGRTESVLYFGLSTGVCSMGEILEVR